MASHVLTQPSSIGTSEGLRNQVGGNLQHHAVFTTRQLISNVPVKKKSQHIYYRNKSWREMRGAGRNGDTASILNSSVLYIMHLYQ